MIQKYMINTGFASRAGGVSSLKLFVWHWNSSRAYNINKNSYTLIEPVFFQKCIRDPLFTVDIFIIYATYIISNYILWTEITSKNWTDEFTVFDVEKSKFQKTLGHLKCRYLFLRRTFFVPFRDNIQVLKQPKVRVNWQINELVKEKQTKWLWI